MKEKRVLVLLIVLGILFSALLITAQDDKEITKSYDCLKKKLNNADNNCGGTANTAENAFDLLAIAYDSELQGECKNALINKKKTDCWPESGNSAICTIKATAIASIALKKATNTETADNIRWLKSKRKLATELIWFLEIDAINATQCFINGQSFNIADNKKISGSDPQGLSKSYNNYWFQINDLTKNYTISCNSSFITALLYKKPNSGIYYVSSETNSAAASDSTTEYINGYCFSTSGNCEYEGTLWGAMALIEVGEEITPYIPYLTAMADESVNAKYLPYAFLFMIDGQAIDYLSGFLSLQKLNKYWDVSGNKFYDTALALLALQTGTYQEATNAKNYLITQRSTTGDNDGCWPSDTAFILYSAWPKTPATGPVGPSVDYCEDYNYTCTSASECSVNNKLTSFECRSLSQVCCSVRPIQQTCEQKSGFVCKNDEECTGTTVPSLDENSCCVSGSCQKISTANECVDNEGTCSSECAKDEEENTAYTGSCGVGEYCCFKKIKTGPNWWLIILLIILIILVILAIIFRNQLKIWWFKTKSGFKSKKGPQPSTRPSPMPLGQRPVLMPRQIIPRPASGRPLTRPIQGRPAPPQGRAQKDKEFEDTMKKLKDMSK